MICRRLRYAIRDEADGVIFYRKLRDMMEHSHSKHNEMLEKIILDESEHILDLETISNEMGCSELNKKEIIHCITEDIEKKLLEIKNLSSNIFDKGIEDKIIELTHNIYIEINEIEKFAKG